VVLTAEVVYLAWDGTPPGGSVRLKRLMRRMCGSVRLKRHKPPKVAFQGDESGQVTGSEAIGGAIALPYRYSLD
jgi:hypothetical protein